MAVKAFNKATTGGILMKSAMSIFDLAMTYWVGIFSNKKRVFPDG